MNTIEPTPLPNNAQQVLATALAHRVERMSKEELEQLAAEAQLALQTEIADLRKRLQQAEQEAAQHRQTIEKRDAEILRLQYQISRSFFSEKDWENFDPSEYTIPFEETLAELMKLKE